MTVPPSPAGYDPDPPDGSGANDATPAAPSTHQEELRSFLFFTVVMAPVIAVLLVAGYGFVVWMHHLLAGPPVS